MSRGGKNKRRRNARSGTVQAERPEGWHLRLELFRRQVMDKSPAIVTIQLHGWELHAAYKPVPLGNPEPWSLTAHPIGERPNYGWLKLAAEFMGVPAEDTAQLAEATEEAGLAVVSWTWAAPITGKTLI